MLLKIIFSIFIVTCTQLFSMQPSIQISLSMRISLQKQLSPQEQLFKAARDHNLYAMRKLLMSKQTHANVTNAKQSPILHYTVKYGNLKSVKLLLQSDANIHATDQSNLNNSILHVAIEAERKIKFIQFLIDKGADVNAINKLKETPLHFCINNFNTIDIMKLLLNNNASINAVDKFGSTSLHKAAKVSVNKTELLLNYKANIDQLDNKGNNALHIAVSNKQFNIIKLLLQNNADAHQKNNHEKTPLDFAWKTKNLKIIELLDWR